MNNIKQQVPNRLFLILAYLAIYVVWGTTYLANLYALEGFRAFQMSGFRFITAGIILLLLSPVKQLGWPSLRELKVLSISGILMLVGGSGLVAYSQEYISSGYAAVLVATEPLWFILLDKTSWRQYFSNFYVILGILVGFAGIILFIWYTPGDNNIELQGPSVNGTVIALLSSVLWVMGALFAKRNIPARKDTGFRTAIQLFTAGLFAFLLATFRGEWVNFSLTQITFNAWAGMLYLIVFGSIITYVAFNWLITVQPPALVSTHTYVNPIVAMFVGWLVVGESVNFMQLLALFVVLTGIMLAQLKSKTT